MGNKYFSDLMSFFALAWPESPISHLFHPWPVLPFATSYDFELIWPKHVFSNSTWFIGIRSLLLPTKQNTSFFPIDHVYGLLSDFYHVWRLACLTFIMSDFYHVWLLSCPTFIMSDFHHVWLLSCLTFIMSDF